MLIGVISDIHGPLPEIVHQVFANCSAILCAGDTMSLATYNELQSIAPTCMVYGNCDRHMDYGPRVTDKVSPSFEGVRFTMAHKKEDVGALPKDCQCVITGHTHVASCEYERGIIWLNPGSPTRPRGDGKPTVGMVAVEERELMKAEIIDLNNPGPMLREFSDEAGYDSLDDDDFGEFAGEFDGRLGFDFGEIR